MSPAEVLDTAGHYAGPDILRLKIDRSPHHVVEPMGWQFEEMGDVPQNSPNGDDPA
jgi:hypothetical protein